MSEFFITLPSNTLYEGNRSNDFTVQLARSVQLTGSWEMALSEIIYPVTWPNLQSLLEKETSQSTTAIHVVFQDDSETITLNLPAGHYDTIHDLLAGIATAGEQAALDYTRQHIPENEETFLLSDTEAVLRKTRIARFNRSFHFRFDQILKRVSVNFDETLINQIILSDTLKYMMRFESRFLTSDKEQALYSPDMKGGIDALFVYCNLVEPQIVGDKMANLLRIVHVGNASHGSSVEKCFYSEHYVPVLSKDLSNIHIQIKTDNNVLIPFENGKVICKLKFRKRRSLFE